MMYYPDAKVGKKNRQAKFSTQKKAKFKKKEKLARSNSQKKGKKRVKLDLKIIGKEK